MPKPLPNRIVFLLKAWKWITGNFFGGAWNYRLSYLADLSLATYFLLWEIFIWHSTIVPVITGRIAGFLLFSLSEYILHRWIYHRIRGFVRDLHEVHHVEPQRLIATPWFLTTSIALGIWWLLIARSHHHFTSAVFAGWQGGTIWYGVVHHGHHHWKIRNAWMRKVKAHHLVHHHFPGYNFGISSRMWDTIFGTRYERTVTKSLHHASNNER